jgi:hypothetical protein
MRRIAFYCLVLLAATGVLPAQAPAQELPPHAWLFGAWVGGLYPAPVTLGAEQCLAQPVVIFTRDLAMRATLTNVTMVQREIETVRATATGAEFRFEAPLQPPAEAGSLFGSPENTALVGFGCESTDVLHVQRQGENQISFPHCPEFPYPLIRCPAR